MESSISENKKSFHINVTFAIIDYALLCVQRKLQFKKIQCPDTLEKGRMIKEITIL